MNSYATHLIAMKPSKVVKYTLAKVSGIPIYILPKGVKRR